MYPKLFELGPFPIHTYGVLLAAAFLVGTAVLARLAEKQGVSRNQVWDLGFVILISALLGAKLLMVLTDAGYYLSQPSRLLSLSFWRAGGVYYGGLLGALLGSYVYIRRHPRLQFLTMADAAAPAIALGQSIGRLGCFSAGCDYGVPGSVPWTVTFTSEYAGQYVGVPLQVPLHPVQLYESGGTLLLFLGLLVVHGRKRFPGQVICLYLLGYALLRFILEFFRGDLDRGLLFGDIVSVSQAVSVILVIVSVPVYRRLSSRAPEKRA